MNRIIGPVAIAAAALAVKVVAQTPAAQSPDPNVVIVSGCVQSAASPPSSSTSVKLGTPGVTRLGPRDCGGHKPARSTRERAHHQRDRG